MLPKPKNQEPLAIEVPKLSLKSASVDEHCEALIGIRKAPFWWYMGAGKTAWNFSVPFRDRLGVWWYQVKPGLCWPADFLTPVDVMPDNIPLRRRFLGYQHLASRKPGNSTMYINVIEDLPSFDLHSIDCKRRNIRAGIKSCILDVMERPDHKTFLECAALWEDFTARTGWKAPVDRARFVSSWDRLFDIPGVSVIIGRDAESGRIAGFLITKIIGNTAYVDTIASLTGLLKTRVNDIIMHSFIRNAQLHPRVKKAHYSLMSYKESLEKFKRSHGFKPVGYPAFTRLSPGVAGLIRLVSIESYNRMMGRMETVEP